MENEKKLQDDLSAVVEEVNQATEQVAEAVAEEVAMEIAEETAEVVADTIVTEEVAKEPFKVFATEDEFNKILQSTSGKAKGEILKELGINSVNDFKEQFAKVEQYQKIADELTSIQAKTESLLAEKLHLEQVVLASKYPMSEEASKMFTELVSVKRGDRDLLEVADEVYNTLQGGFKQLPTKVVFGADRSEAQNLTDDPFIKGFKK